jgi:hypothetical protein
MGDPPSRVRGYDGALMRRRDDCLPKFCAGRRPNPPGRRRPRSARPQRRCRARGSLAARQPSSPCSDFDLCTRSQSVRACRVRRFSQQIPSLLETVDESSRTRSPRPTRVPSGAAVGHCMEAAAAAVGHSVQSLAPSSDAERATMGQPPERVASWRAGQRRVLRLLSPRRPRARAHAVSNVRGSHSISSAVSSFAVHADETVLPRPACCLLIPIVLVACVGAL